MLNLVQKVSMYQINRHQAKTRLSKRVQESTYGKEIIIPEADKPMARLFELEETGINQDCLAV